MVRTVGSNFKTQGRAGRERGDTQKVDLLTHTQNTHRPEPSKTTRPTACTALNTINNTCTPPCSLRPPAVRRSARSPERQRPKHTTIVRLYDCMTMSTEYERVASTISPPYVLSVHLRRPRDRLNGGINPRHDQMAPISLSSKLPNYRHLHGP